MEVDECQRQCHAPTGRLLSPSHPTSSALTIQPVHLLYLVTDASRHRMQNICYQLNLLSSSLSPFARECLQSFTFSESNAFIHLKAAHSFAVRCTEHGVSQRQADRFYPVGPIPICSFQVTKNNADTFPIAHDIRSTPLA